MKLGWLILGIAGMAILLSPAANAQNFGAIAYSESTGNWGSSYNYHSRERAIASAIQRCGQPDCDWKVWFSNSCGALAKASNGALGWSYKCDSPREAKARALAECRKRGDDCEVLCWACTDR